MTAKRNDPDPSEARSAAVRPEIMGEPRATDFSIIIPAYNEGECLPTCLRALAKEAFGLSCSGKG